MNPAPRNNRSFDPIVLGAQARPVIAKLHERSDVIVRMTSNQSEWESDRAGEREVEPGHFRADKIILTLNLDKLVVKGQNMPTSLESLEDFRPYPVLGGVAAHESAHARFSLWDDVPSHIDNPDFDPTAKKGRRAAIERYPIGKNSPLLKIAEALEEPRVERLGMVNFTKTWRRFMTFSAGYFVGERIEEARNRSEGKVAPLDQALAMMIAVGGRKIAGTLGATSKSRDIVERVMKSAEAIIKKAHEGKETADPEAFHNVMRLISEATFSNNHTDAEPYLQIALKIVNQLHPEPPEPDEPEEQEPQPGEGEPEEQEPQDNTPMPGKGDTAESKPQKPEPGSDDSGAPEGDEQGDDESEGSGDDESEGDEQDDESEGSGDDESDDDDDPFGMNGDGDEDEDMSAALDALAGELAADINDLTQEVGAIAEAESEAPEQKDGSGGYGSQMFKNSRAPQVNRHEVPTAEDRDRYRRATAWMEAQIQPTVTEWEQSSWMPAGGARLNVRHFIRDDIAGREGSNRSDWDRVSETVKPAPPVKAAIMLDGSGSMSSLARFSASIAWAAANAAAMLPEAKTVSVVFGDRAQITQEVGNQPSRDVAVMNTNGGMEDFIGASQIIEEALELDVPLEDGERENVLIVIVSDLRFYGKVHHDQRDLGYTCQADAFQKITRDWQERGYRVVVVGSSPAHIEEMKTGHTFRTCTQSGIGLTDEQADEILDGYAQYVELLDKNDLFAL